MIPKIIVLTIFLGLSWQEAVYGAAYSKVYVQNGPDVIPVEYLNYGAPPVVSNAQIAQLSGPPVGSVLPLPNLVAPCVAPCILPGQTIGTVAAAQPSAKFIAYNSPKVPAVVVPNNDDKTSYEYSYVVYDEITGDRKAQRELSDGSVVHGEYSFIQPDGYVREVKYTADDLTGFNAVVKNFLPSDYGKEKIPEVNTDATQPCQDIKKEAIKVEPEAVSPKLIEEPVHEELSMTTQEESHEPTHEPTHELAHDHDHSHDHVHEPDHAHDHVHYHDHDHHDHGHDHIHVHELDPEHHHEHVHSEDIELTVIPTAEIVPVFKVTPTTESQPTITKQEPAAELIKEPLTLASTHESVQKPTAQEAPKPGAAIPNALAAYSDIIKCIQAAIANNSNAPKTNISPLTYIILPGGNKPC